MNEKLELVVAWDQKIKL